MTGDEARSRAAMFDANNRLAFDRPVDEAARAWWLARFFDPHGLTPEGMGDLLTRSVSQEKLTRYDFIDGIGQAFRIRVEGRFVDGSQIWFVERTLSLAGGVFDADEMFIPDGEARFGRGRRLMLDLIRLAERLGVERIKVEARKIGRYAWLRMGFVPDEGSWRDMRGVLVRELFRVERELGADKVTALLRQIATGKPEIAGVLAALTDPVPSIALIEYGRPVTVPLGKALFIDAVGDWSGEFEIRGEGRIALAAAYVEGVTDER